MKNRALGEIHSSYYPSGNFLSIVIDDDANSKYTSSHSKANPAQSILLVGGRWVGSNSVPLIDQPDDVIDAVIQDLLHRKKNLSSDLGFNRERFFFKKEYENRYITRIAFHNVMTRRGPSKQMKSLQEYERFIHNHIHDSITSHQLQKLHQIYLILNGSYFEPFIPMNGLQSPL